MNILVWVLQGLLAAFFVVPGMTKVFTTKKGLVEKKMITDKDPVAPVRFIGAMELLGVIGIILPWLLQLFPMLTPIAATGFGIVMIGAFSVHFTKKEYKILPVLFLSFIMALVVAWFRF